MDKSVAWLVLLGAVNAPPHDAMLAVAIQGSYTWPAQTGMISTWVTYRS